MKVVHNNENEAQVKAVEDQAKNLDEGLRDIMQNKRARDWLFDRIDMHAHPNSRSHVPGDADSTAFNEGARSVGEAMLDEIRTMWPNEYVAALKTRMFDA